MKVLGLPETTARGMSREIVNEGILTSPISTTHGTRTIKANAAEIKVGGTLCSGRKVCFISGRTRKVDSSGCSGNGCDFGRTRSKRSTEMGSYFAVPIMRDTLRGLLLGVGGKESGGFLRF